MGKTPLHYAASCGCHNNIALLARNKMLVDLPDKEGYTPLYAAVENDHQLATAQLIKAEASVHKEMKINNVRFITPLERAAANNNIEMARLLLDSGANIDQFISYFSVTQKTENNSKLFNAFKETVELHEELKSNSFEKIPSLLNKNPIVNFTDANLDTPLHRAIKSTYMEPKEKIYILQKLLEKNALIYMKNSQGLYPFELPEADTEIKSLLIPIEMKIVRIIDKTSIKLIQKLSDAAYQLKEDIKVCSLPQYYTLPKHLISDILFYEIRLLVRHVKDFFNLNHPIINLLSKICDEYFIAKNNEIVSNFSEQLFYYTLSSRESKNIHALICNLQLLHLDLIQAETLENFKRRDKNIISVVEEFVQDHQLKPIENFKVPQLTSVNAQVPSLFSETNQLWTKPNKNNGNNNNSPGNFS